MLSISKQLFLGSTPPLAALGAIEPSSGSTPLSALAGTRAASARDAYQPGPAGRSTASGCASRAAGSESELAILIQLLSMLFEKAQAAGGCGEAGLPLAGSSGPSAAAQAFGGPALNAASLRAPGRDLGALTNGWGNVVPNGALGGANATPPNALAGRALDWSQAQMNPMTATGVNPNNGTSAGQNPDAWTNWCLAFVSAAYGYNVPELHAMTAFDSFKTFASEGKIVQDRNPPAGAPVYFDQTAGTPWGHVGIATGKTTASGEPIIRTTGKPGSPGIYELPLSVVEKESARYIGWARI